MGRITAVARSVFH